MPRLKKIATGPKEFSEAYNELILAVSRLMKMKGGGGITVHWHSGIPLLVADKQQETRCLIGKSAGIPGRTDETPGSGTVTLWRFDADGDLEETAEEVTAYNLAEGAVEEDVFLMLKQHVSGKLLVDWEECPSA